MVQAWWFAVLTTGLTLLVCFVPAMAVMVVTFGFVAPAQGAGPPPVTMVLIICSMMAIAMGVGWVATLIGAAIWGLATHGLLRMTGGTEHSLRRTYQAICYSSGAFTATAVPCIGQYLGWVWWLVSAVLMVREAHQVRGGRAAFVTLTPPVILVVGFFALYMGFVTLVMVAGTAARGPFGTATQDAQTVLDGLRASMVAGGGAGPAHAGELLAGGPLSPAAFVDGSSLTGIGDVPLGNGTLMDYFTMAPAVRQASIQAEAAALPSAVVAHRLGDFVFTHHGIDLDTADPGLWLVILSPDPDINPPGTGRFAAGRADGTVLAVSSHEEMLALLQAQNALRGAAGLPPLPDPQTVTHDEPAE